MDSKQSSENVSMKQEPGSIQSEPCKVPEIEVLQSSGGKEALVSNKESNIVEIDPAKSVSAESAGECPNLESLEKESKTSERAPDCPESAQQTSSQIGTKPVTSEMEKETVSRNSQELTSAGESVQLPHETPQREDDKRLILEPEEGIERSRAETPSKDKASSGKSASVEKEILSKSSSCEESNTSKPVPAVVEDKDGKLVSEGVKAETPTGDTSDSASRADTECKASSVSKDFEGLDDTKKVESEKTIDNQVDKPVKEHDIDMKAESEKSVTEMDVDSQVSEKPVLKIGTIPKEDKLEESKDVKAASEARTELENKGLSSGNLLTKEDEACKEIENRSSFQSKESKEVQSSQESDSTFDRGFDVDTQDDTQMDVEQGTENTSMEVEGDDVTQTEELTQSQSESSEDTYCSDLSASHLNKGFRVVLESESERSVLDSTGSGGGMSQATTAEVGDLETTHSEGDMFATQGETQADVTVVSSYDEFKGSGCRLLQSSSTLSSEMTSNSESSATKQKLSDSRASDKTSNSEPLSAKKQKTPSSDDTRVMSNSATDSDASKSSSRSEPRRKRKLEDSDQPETCSKLQCIEEENEEEVKKVGSPTKVTLKNNEVNIMTSGARSRLTFDSNTENRTFVLKPNKETSSSSHRKSPEIQVLLPSKKTRESIEVVYESAKPTQKERVDVIDLEDSQLDDDSSGELCLHLSLSPSPPLKPDEDTTDSKATSQDSHKEHNGQVEKEEHGQVEKEEHEQPRKAVTIVIDSDGESQSTPTQQPVKMPKAESIEQKILTPGDVATTPTESSISGIEPDPGQQLKAVESTVSLSFKLISHILDNKVVLRQILQCGDIAEVGSEHHSDYHHSSSGGLGDCSKNTSPSSVTSGPLKGPFPLQPTRLSMMSMISSSSSSSSASSVPQGGAKNVSTNDGLFRVPNSTTGKLSLDYSLEGIDHLIQAINNFVPKVIPKPEVNSKLSPSTETPKSKMKPLKTSTVKKTSLFKKNQNKNQKTEDKPAKAKTVKRSLVETENTPAKAKSAKRSRVENATTVTKQKTPKSKIVKSERAIKTPVIAEDGQLVPGLKVFARWTDKKYYSATLKERNKDGRWAVLFDDGKEKSLMLEYIIAVKSLEKGQSVYALASDEDEYYSGVIVNTEKKRGEDVYFVELDDGDTVDVTRSDLFMTEDQARNLKESVSIASPAKTTPQRITDVTLDNVLEGKRSRTCSKEVQKVLHEAAGGSGSRKSTPRRKNASPATSESDTGASTDFIDGVDPENSGFETKSLKVKGISKESAKKNDSSSSYGPIPEVGSKIFAGKCFLLSGSKANINTCRVRSEEGRESSDGQYLSDPEQTTVLFSKSHLTKQIRAGGGELYERVSDIPPSMLSSCYLVSNKPSHTALYILSLVYGIRIISHMWVTVSCQKNSCAPIQAFSLPAGWSLEKEKFINQSESPKRPLNRTKVGLVRESKKFFKFWKEVLESAGAKVTDVTPEKSLKELDALHVVVSNQCSIEIAKQVHQLEKPLVTTTWVIQCLINGRQCPFDGHAEYSCRNFSCDE